MELRQLRFFLTLAEELHFRRAAEREHLAVGAFSEQIQRLERELGVQLLTRTSRRVELTAAGRALVEDAEAVLAASGRLVRHAAALHREASHRLAVGLGAADIVLTPSVLRAFEEEHPQVHLQVRQFGYEDPSAGLRAGTSDVGVLWGPQTTTGWDVTLLRTEPRVAVLPETHPLAASGAVRSADLLPETWLDVPARDPVWRSFWLLDDLRDGTPAELGAQTSTRDGLLELVAAGRGVALLPAVVADHVRAPGTVFVPVPDAPPCTIVVAVPSGGAPAAAHAFVDVARRVATAGHRSPAGADRSDPGA